MKLGTIIQGLMLCASKKICGASTLKVYFPILRLSFTVPRSFLPQHAHANVQDLER